MEGFSDYLKKQYSEEEIISLYLASSNKKISEIANEASKSVAEIYRILHSNNISPNRLRTNHQNVIDYATSGMQVHQIAELTGYSPRNVRYILAKLKTESND